LAPSTAPVHIPSGPSLAALVATMLSEVQSLRLAQDGLRSETNTAHSALVVELERAGSELSSLKADAAGLTSAARSSKDADVERAAHELASEVLPTLQSQYERGRAGVTQSRAVFDAMDSSNSTSLEGLRTIVRLMAEAAAKAAATGSTDPSGGPITGLQARFATDLAAVKAAVEDIRADMGRRQSALHKAKVDLVRSIADARANLTLCKERLGAAAAAAAAIHAVAKSSAQASGDGGDKGDDSASRTAPSSPAAAERSKPAEPISDRIGLLEAMTPGPAAGRREASPRTGALAQQRAVLLSPAPAAPGLSRRGGEAHTFIAADVAKLAQAVSELRGLIPAAVGAEAFEASLKAAGELLQRVRVALSSTAITTSADHVGLCATITTELSGLRDGAQKFRGLHASAVAGVVAITRAVTTASQAVDHAIHGDLTGFAESSPHVAGLLQAVAALKRAGATTAAGTPATEYVESLEVVCTAAAALTASINAPSRGKAPYDSAHTTVLTALGSIQALARSAQEAASRTASNTSATLAKLFARGQSAGLQLRQLATALDGMVGKADSRLVDVDKYAPAIAVTHKAAAAIEAASAASGAGHAGVDALRAAVGEITGQMQAVRVAAAMLSQGDAAIIQRMQAASTTLYEVQETLKTAAKGASGELSVSPSAASAGLVASQLETLLHTVTGGLRGASEAQEAAWRRVTSGLEALSLPGAPAIPSLHTLTHLVRDVTDLHQATATAQGTGSGAAVAVAALASEAATLRNVVEQFKADALLLQEAMKVGGDKVHVAVQGIANCIASTPDVVRALAQQMQQLQAVQADRRDIELKATVTTRMSEQLYQLHAIAPGEGPVVTIARQVAALNDMLGSSGGSGGSGSAAASSPSAGSSGRAAVTVSQGLELMAYVTTELETMKSHLTATNDKEAAVLEAVLKMMDEVANLRRLVTDNLSSDAAARDKIDDLSKSLETIRAETATVRVREEQAFARMRLAEAEKDTSERVARAEQEALLQAAATERKRLESAAAALKEELHITLASVEASDAEQRTRLETMTTSLDAVKGELAAVKEREEATLARVREVEAAREAALLEAKREREELLARAAAERAKLEAQAAALRDEMTSAINAARAQQSAAESAVEVVRVQMAAQAAAEADRLRAELEVAKIKMQAVVEAADRAKAEAERMAASQVALVQAEATTSQTRMLKALEDASAERNQLVVAARDREVALEEFSREQLAKLQTEAEAQRRKLEEAVAEAEARRAAVENESATHVASLMARSAAEQATLKAAADEQRLTMEAALERVRRDKVSAEETARLTNMQLQEKLSRAQAMHETALREIREAAEGYQLAAELREQMQGYERALAAERRRVLHLERALGLPSSPSVLAIADGPAGATSPTATPSAVRRPPVRLASPPPPLRTLDGGEGTALVATPATADQPIAYLLPKSPDPHHISAVASAALARLGIDKTATPTVRLGDESAAAVHELAHEARIARMQQDLDAITNGPSAVVPTPGTPAGPMLPLTASSTGSKRDVTQVLALARAAAAAVSAAKKREVASGDGANPAAVVAAAAEAERATEVAMVRLKQGEYMASGLSELEALAALRYRECVVLAEAGDVAAKHLNMMRKIAHEVQREVRGQAAARQLKRIQREAGITSPPGAFTASITAAQSASPHVGGAPTPAARAARAVAESTQAHRTPALAALWAATTAEAGGGASPPPPPPPEAKRSLFAEVHAAAAAAGEAVHKVGRTPRPQPPSTVRDTLGPTSPLADELRSTLQALQAKLESVGMDGSASSAPASLESPPLAAASLGSDSDAAGGGGALESKSEAHAADASAPTPAAATVAAAPATREDMVAEIAELERLAALGSTMMAATDGAVAAQSSTA